MALIRTSRTFSTSQQRAEPARPRTERRVAQTTKKEETFQASSLKGASYIRKRELIPFTRQTAGMLNAGMSIIAAIGTLQEQASHKGFHALLTSLRSSIESGAPFSEGLSLYPEIFSDIYVNMVKAGESSGQFAEIMRRLASLLESSARLVRKVKSAMTYPVIILCLAVIIAFLIITFVVPVFTEMYADFGSALPLPTMILVAISDGISEYWYILLGGLVLTGWILGRWARTNPGRRAMHRLILRVPVFGELVHKVVIARFARLLGQMLTSGISILDAMEITARSCGNILIEESLMAARHSVEEGQTLSGAMEDRPYLPTLMVRMTGAGEKSGRLDEMLVNVADAYDDEVETMLATLTSLIEPFLMIFLGIFIGAIVIALFLPIFGITNVISQ